MYFIKPSIISNPIYYDIPSEKFDTIKEKAQNEDCNALRNLYLYYDLYEHKEDGCIVLEKLLKCDKKNKFYPKLYSKMFKANKCEKIVDLNKRNLSQLKQRNLFEYIYIHIKYGQ